MKAYIDSPSKFFLIEVFTLFISHWSIYLCQSNQRFQAIEFVNSPVPEKLYIFRINLHCMAFVTPKLLSPVSTVSGRNAWHNDLLFGADTRKKKKKTEKKRLHFRSATARSTS